MSEEARQSRVWVKFVRHKPALVSLLVISVYILLGIAVLCGMVTVDDTSQPFAAPAVKTSVPVGLPSSYVVPLTRIL